MKLQKKHLECFRKLKIEIVKNFNMNINVLDGENSKYKSFLGMSASNRKEPNRLQQSGISPINLLQTPIRLQGSNINQPLFSSNIRLQSSSN